MLVSESQIRDLVLHGARMGDDARAPVAVAPVSRETGGRGRAITGRLFSLARLFDPVAMLARKPLWCDFADIKRRVRYSSAIPVPPKTTYHVGARQWRPPSSVEAVHPASCTDSVETRERRLGK